MPSNKKNIRRCCACFEHAPKEELLRFVRTPDGRVEFDPDQKLDGRGVWVHKRKSCIDKLKKKRLLSSAFKTAVGEDVYAETDGVDYEEN